MSAKEQNPFLMLITDYNVPKSLAELAAFTAATGLPRYFEKVRLVSDYQLTEKKLNYTFASSPWTDSTSIKLKDLQAHLPSGVQVSPKAKGVAMWNRILKALDRPVSYVAAQDERAFFLMPSASAGYYLVTIDFANRVWACSSPEYTGDDAERYVLDKHIVSALTYYRNEILDRVATPGEAREWKESYSKCSTIQDLEANWIYYFIKTFIPRMKLRAGHYTDVSAVDAAVSYLEEQ